MRSFPLILLAAAVGLAGGCDNNAASDNAAPDNAAPAPAAAPEPPAKPAEVTLSRLHCGGALIKNFDKFFSDRPRLYEPGARPITDSCYLIRHGDQAMLWD